MAVAKPLTGLMNSGLYWLQNKSVSLSQTPPLLFKQGASATVKFIVYAAFSVMLITADSNLGFLSKMRGAITVLINPVIEGLLLPRDTFFALADRYSTVLELNEKISVLEKDLRTNAKVMLQIDQLQKENNDLRALLNLREKLNRPSVNAEIRYELPDIYSDKVVINKGTKDGVKLGNPVITASGILGQVSRVYGKKAELTLISDNSLSIPVSLPSSGVIAITKGRGNSSSFELQYSDLSAEVKVGDEVLTSGLGGIYPPGILVGHIISVNPAIPGQFPNVIGRTASVAGAQHQVMILTEKESSDGS